MDIPTLTTVANQCTGLMMSKAGDVRCQDCALVDNLRAGAELDQLPAPYGTTGTYNTVIAVNTAAMKLWGPLPQTIRDDCDKGITFGWCVYSDCVKNLIDFQHAILWSCIPQRSAHQPALVIYYTVQTEYCPEFRGNMRWCNTPSDHNSHHQC